MLKKHVCLVAICLCFTMFVVVARAEKVVQLNTLDWEPYIGRKLPDRGFVATIVTEAFAASGYRVELSFLPWIRAKAMAKDGKADGCMPEYYLEEDKADFLISDPFPGGPLGFLKKTSDPISYGKLEELKGHKIGIVRGYVNTVEFDKADYLTKEEANDDLTNIRKLMGGRLDLVVIDKFVGFDLMRQEMPERVGEIEFLSPPLEEKTLHVLIAKKVADAEEKMNAFNEGLKKIKENGRLKAIMQEKGL